MLELSSLLFFFKNSTSRTQKPKGGSNREIYKMKIQRVTSALCVVVLMTMVFYVAKSGSGDSIASAQKTTSQRQLDKQAAMQRHLEARRTFPVVDFNEPEPSDPTKRAIAQEKQSRRNTLSEVKTIPHPDTTETQLYNERGDELSALPIEKSDLIVTGNVVSAEAHLSGNKKNIVSEFSIYVEKVYKPSGSTDLTPGSSITVERFGGFVRYPNGQTVLYRWAGTSMPKIGGRYLLFLAAISHSNDYEILTGYELGEKVSPLDATRQFETFRGKEVSELLKRLNDSLMQHSSRSASVSHN